MSQSTTKQHYPFSFRTACAVNVTACTSKIIMFLIPPENALTIEQLYCHFRMTFDSAISSGDRVIEYIGIQDEVPLSVSVAPHSLKKFDVNVVADGSRKVDIRLDLSSLLTKSKAGYRDYFTDPGGYGLTYVVVKFRDALATTSNVGTIDLWKLDGLFTTQGIR